MREPVRGVIANHRQPFASPSDLVLRGEFYHASSDPHMPVAISILRPQQDHKLNDFHIMAGLSPAAVALGVFQVFWVQGFTMTIDSVASLRHGVGCAMALRT